MTTLGCKLAQFSTRKSQAQQICFLPTGREGNSYRLNYKEIRTTYGSLEYGQQQLSRYK